MTSTSNKFRINISAKILLLVLSLAILLASFGGYSVYVINSIGLKIERLNQIESVLETRINNMNSARIESANMASTSAISGNGCPMCATLKKSGKSSCCGPGGAWFKNCGNPGDSKFGHTWFEGIEACKGTTLAAFAVEEG